MWYCSDAARLVELLSRGGPQSVVLELRAKSFRAWLRSLVSAMGSWLANR